MAGSNGMTLKNHWRNRQFGKAELADSNDGDPTGLFAVAPRTPHVWRDRGELPAPDERCNAGDSWYRETILLWAVRTGRVRLIRSPEVQAEAQRLHVKSSRRRREKAATG
jgi:hypothetical protein